MKSRVAIFAFAVVLGSTVNVFAQTMTDGLLRNESSTAAVSPAPPAPAQVLTMTLNPKRPAGLSALYGGYVGLQIGDAALTLKAIHLGAHEANAPMVDIVKHPALLYSAKAAVAASTIFCAERLWRQGKRKTAVLMMAGGNIVMGVVVNHNRQVIDLLKR